jgi:hypothetical protein
LHDLSSAIARHFPALEVRSCFLTLYPEQPGSSNSSSQLVLAYTESGAFQKFENAAARRTDLARWLLDSGVSGAFYVAALFSEERVLGYALLDLGNREGIVYEALREFLSAALRGIALHTRSRQTDAPPALA